MSTCRSRTAHSRILFSPAMSRFRIWRRYSRHRSTSCPKLSKDKFVVFGGWQAVCNIFTILGSDAVCTQGGHGAPSGLGPSQSTDVAPLVWAIQVGRKLGSACFPHGYAQTHCSTVSPQGSTLQYGTTSPWRNTCRGDDRGLAATSIAGDSGDDAMSRVVDVGVVIPDGIPPALEAGTSCRGASAG